MHSALTFQSHITLVSVKPSNLIVNSFSQQPVKKHFYWVEMSTVKVCLEL